MVRSILVAGALALGVTAAIAQANVIEQRQALMKQFGDTTRTFGGMLRGQVPFDLAQAQAALRIYSANAKQLPALFPENSKTGNKTQALPVIWENKTEFNTIFAKLDQDAQNAVGAVKDEASFKVEGAKVVQNCGGCHNRFREKQS